MGNKIITEGLFCYNEERGTLMDAPHRLEYHGSSTHATGGGNRCRECCERGY